MTKAYAGIGSRSTPEDIRELMTWAAHALEQKGYTLRSGHAEGADLAFEAGADGKAEIYLPWPKFNVQFPSTKGTYVQDAPAERAYEMAERHHPAWERVRRGGRALHARNCHQVLGRDLDDPVKFVLCWTADGQATGGTGQAIRLAESLEIPVFNLHNNNVRARIEALVDRVR